VKVAVAEVRKGHGRVGTPAGAAFSFKGIFSFPQRGLFPAGGDPPAPPRVMAWT
jgi:hypothetical protein